MLESGYTKTRFLFILMSVFFVMLSGCGGPGGEGDDSGDMRVLANINKYALTVNDFKSEVDLTLANKYLSDKPESAKEILLEELISKKILLQEAQKEGLHIEKTFMKEIERYWEQSLLKSLLKKKSQEISREITIDEAEVIRKYERMKRKIFAEMVILKNKVSAEKLAGAGIYFKRVKNDLRLSDDLLDEREDWWGEGDLPESIENVLFSLSPNQVSGPIVSQRKWVVLRILKERKQSVKSYKSMAPVIERDILLKKKQKAFEEWINALRMKATVRINKDVLASIDIKEIE